MDEQHPAAHVADPSTIVGAAALPRAPFDPAGLLDGRRPPPLPIVAGPTVEVAREFDPAAYLGRRALRGAFNLATIKPLVTTLGGVEMVTVPAAAYADALRRVAAQELPAEIVEQAGPVPDAKGMLDLLLSLHSAAAVSIGQLVTATGLDALDLGDRIAAYAAAQPKPWKVDGMENGVITGLTDGGQRFYATPVDDPPSVGFVPTPEEARVELPPEPAEAPSTSEAHGVALDSGHETEAHGAAAAAAKPRRHSRKAGAVPEVP